MALDVHVVDNPGRGEHTSGKRVCWFEESVHDLIFHRAGIDVHRQFAYLRRMSDFYADACFTGRELDGVVADIDRLLPLLAGHVDAVDALNRFRGACVTARAAGKSVLLYCD